MPTMKAIRIHAHGGLDQLRIDDIARPTPGPGQVLVEIKAAALNMLDLWVRRGIPGVPLPVILGSDGAGIVREVGQGASQFKPGDEVLVHPGAGCGSCGDCQNGREQYCQKYSILGEHHDGLMAELVALDEAQLIRKPANIGFEEGAAIPLVFLTAWEMVVNKGQIKPWNTVLVWGASSGVGSAAVQIAKAYGARVITTAGTAKLDRARALGADVVLDHYTQDIAKEIKQLTGGRGIDLIIDHTGVKSWGASTRSLARGGKLIVCGSTTGFEVSMDLRFLYIRQQSILGSTMGPRGDMTPILKLVEAGRLRGVVDRVFPFTEIAQAHEYIETGKHFGKVCLGFA
ncbi:MAG: alcohol dehydrogenase [Acidobacteria bacterium]|nr:alcohol dehydrogenase [Acidobacteriota bacterium]